MTENQKKRLSGAFQTLSAGAQRGKRLVDGGATLAEARKHVADLQLVVESMADAIDNAAGADAVLARAKPLSRSRTSPSSS